jgi:uncharacterized protein YjiS (DUF1127 family)
MCEQCCMIHQIRELNLSDEHNIVDIGIIESFNHLPWCSIFCLSVSYLKPSSVLIDFNVDMCLNIAIISCSTWELKDFNLYKEKRSPTSISFITWVLWVVIHQIRELNLSDEHNIVDIGIVGSYQQNLGGNRTFNCYYHTDQPCCGYCSQCETVVCTYCVATTLSSSEMDLFNTFQLISRSHNSLCMFLSIESFNHLPWCSIFCLSVPYLAYSCVLNDVNVDLCLNSAIISCSTWELRTVEQEME